jgi:hypothetical protein
VHSFRTQRVIDLGSPEHLLQRRTVLIKRSWLQTSRRDVHTMRTHHVVATVAAAAVWVATSAMASEPVLSNTVEGYNRAPQSMALREAQGLATSAGLYVAPCAMSCKRASSVERVDLLFACSPFDTTGAHVHDLLLDAGYLSESPFVARIELASCPRAHHTESALISYSLIFRACEMSHFLRSSYRDHAFN